MSFSPLANPAATRAALERYGLATKHRLGQNFLIDDGVIGKILSLADLDPDDAVLEVGPGMGTLTVALLRACAGVVAIEADPELEPVLADYAAERPGFSYVMGDALAVTGEELDRARERAGLGRPPRALVANLPYNVAATVILKYLDEHRELDFAVVMVQKEVADRIAARPGTRAYGAYTAKLGLIGRVTGRFEVPPSCFMPAPHVDSAVVRIDRYGAGAAEAPAGLVGLGDAERARVGEVVRAAFSQRRKTLRNAMASSGFEKGLLDAAFSEAGIDPRARAETLSAERFRDLAASLAARGALGGEGV